MQHEPVREWVGHGGSPGPSWRAVSEQFIQTDPVKKLRECMESMAKTVNEGRVKSQFKTMRYERGTLLYTAVYYSQSTIQSLSCKEYLAVAVNNNFS